ncbi:kinase-like domain-containing protein [Cercophora newfieldiana]|uniref:non-specific serine/threonine protein kinase n=1 Tax=Cercophora newfieldiana TaxID=92897 RepID=A0AA40CY55_9PEZI|nr:kinase-like domain-containing protein [Cercophora newfieldiana]
MAGRIECFQDLHYLAESFSLPSQESDQEFLYTSFTHIDADDHAYFGCIDKPKLQIPLEEYSRALQLISDEEIYPLFHDSESDTKQPLSAAPDDLNLAIAGAAGLKGIYIKRPPIGNYDWYKEEDCLEIIPATLLEEATALQQISQHPQHPNIVKSYGCRTRRGRITGLMMSKYEENLRELLKKGKAVNKERILKGLESSVRHLHSLGLAHNDINPSNVMMVDEASGEPVLVDFGSCHKIGDKLTASGGTPGWTEDGDDYTHSKVSNDTSALDKIRAWLENPTFE